MYINKMDNTIYLTIITLLLINNNFQYIHSLSINNNNNNNIKNNFDNVLRDSNSNSNNNNNNSFNNNGNNKNKLDLNENYYYENNLSSSVSVPLLSSYEKNINFRNNNNSNNNNNNNLNSNDNVDNKNNNNYNNNNNNFNNDDDKIIKLTLSDQVKLLSKQLNALMMRRREDYKLLENNLRKSLKKSLSIDETGITSHSYNNNNNKNNNNNNDGLIKSKIIDVDIKNELDQLRKEIREIRSSKSMGNKERLTVEWLTQSIAEMRKELTELQEIASKASKDLSHSRRNLEDSEAVRNDFKQLKLELESLKERQQTSEILIRELREEALQKEEDFRRILHNQRVNKADEIYSKENSDDNSFESSEADHKMRHQRFMRQQLHDLEISQRSIKHQLNELQYHRFGERYHNIEMEQRRLANANFNLSRQIAGLDKLHSSMLELLEDVTGIQSKMDKTIPDIKREISKLEFTSAQLNSEQNLLREEGRNIAKSIQAMAVSVSTLQDERDSIKDFHKNVQKIEEDVEHLKSVTEAQKSIVHRTIEKMEINAKSNHHHHKSINNLNENTNAEEKANNLVQQLESVELQYESIINKLPSDCSQVEILSIKNQPSNANVDDVIEDNTNDLIQRKNNKNNNDVENEMNEDKISTSGLYLIAPAGQHRPTMAYCSEGGWTTIQRRYDGSVDFNRTWESYAEGFGSPSGEFWIGNELLHHLTLDNCTQLKIIMTDIYDNTWLAEYKQFYISSRDDGYRLYVADYNGNASDALDYQNRMQFSAIDVDRDISNTHCAANYEGGWWFSHCQHANLNGRYNLGLTWFDATRNEWIAVKSSQMLITKRKHQKCLHSIKKRNTLNNNDNNNNNNNNNFHIDSDVDVNANVNDNSINNINGISSEISQVLRSHIIKSLITTTEKSITQKSLTIQNSNITTISNNGIS